MSEQSASALKLDHVGIVVRDMDEAANNNTARFGLAGVASRFTLHLQDALYRGERVSFSAAYGFINLENVQIELVQALDDAPSPYRDALAEQGEVTHHIAFVVSSIEQHLAMARQAGAELSILFDAVIPPERGRFVYVEGLLHGCLVELIELNSA